MAALDAVRGDSRTRDPDDALRDAIHAAVEAGLYERARMLLDVLAKTTPAAVIVRLDERR